MARPVLGVVKEFRYVFTYASISEFDLKRLHDAVKFAHVRWNAGDRVVISCQGGLRTAGLEMAPFLIKEGTPPRASIDLIRVKRDQDVLCNVAFAKLVLEARQEFIQPLSTSQYGLADW